MKDVHKKWLSVLLIAAIVIFTLWAISNDSRRSSSSSIHIDQMDKADKAKEYPVAIELVNPSGYINTQGINITDLIGKKVILVDFWTYTCINCQRTTPYLNAWYEKYKDQGLEIIGVHTPEFEFEKDKENVTDAVEQYEIKFPVVQDNDYLTWRAYRNSYWPRKYLIDIDGFIVYDHIGEGAYEETEMKIQELLAERAQVLGEDMTTSESFSQPVNAESVDLTSKRSPEIYFGADRNSNLGNGRQAIEGIQQFDEPSDISENTLYLVGDWDIASEYAENTGQNAKIIFKYGAQKVFIVASAQGGNSVRILIDGEQVGEIAGSDVERGVVLIDNEQLYRLIEDDNYAEHVLEIEADRPGLRVYTFTFG